MTETTTAEAPVRVRMLQHISGGRGPDEWPHIGETLVCGAVEADQLIRAKLAILADGADAGDGAQTAASVGGGEPAGSPEPENGSQPLVRDPKQAWVDHAVEQGAAPEDAAAMTKADLIEKYGNP